MNAGPKSAQICRRFTFFFQILEEYNERQTPMNLVLFDDALDHLTRVHRVLRMSQGHALLVGVGGSGKQSICRLASFTAECEVFEIQLSRGYNEQSFREDLKVLYNKLGIENRRIVFLFTDQHVVEDGELLIQHTQCQKVFASESLTTAELEFFTFYA
jgi:dynein heavy chain